MLKRLVTIIVGSVVMFTSLVGPFALNGLGTALTVPYAQAQNNADEERLQNQYALPSCFNLAEGFSVVGCLGQALYWGGWWTTQFLVARAGGFMDYFIYYSIESSTYRGVPYQINDRTTTFIDEGWRIVRDLSNLIFIFGLIYIAIALIVRANVGGSSPKRLLIYLIVMALLINFSLFFARVVVDAGNILARTIYNEINLVNRGTENDDLTGPDGVKSVGLMFISLSNPQALMSAQQTGVNSFDDVDGATSNIFVMITLAAIIFNVILIFVFVTVGIYFVARVVGLYFVMIFAPFAFASLAIPKGSTIRFVGFQSWMQNLINLSMMAPVFLFFLYLTVRFLSLGIPINPNVAGGSELAKTFMQIALPFALASGFLIIAKSQAKRMSGEIGKAVATATTATLGGAAALSLGAAAVAGGAVGGIGKAVGSSSRVKNMANTGRLKFRGKEYNFGRAGRAIGKQAVFGGNRMARTNFDLRSNKMAQKAGRVISQGAAIGGAGSEINSIKVGNTWGKSYANYQEENEKKVKEREERKLQELQLTGLDAKRYDDEAAKRNAGLDPEKSQQYEQYKADAEKAFTETEAYKKASDIGKERKLLAMREKFDKEYKKGNVVTGFTADGKADPNQFTDLISQEVAALTRERDKELKDTRLNQLLTKLESSPWWANASDQERDKRRVDIQKSFDTIYQTGKVVTDVDNQGFPLQQSFIDVTDHSDVGWDAQYATPTRSDAEKILADETKYKRMETSAELNRQATKEFGILKRDSGPRSLRQSTNRAKEEFGRDKVKATKSEKRTNEYTQKLSNSLNSLNETLGEFLHLQDEGIDLTARDPEDLIKATRQVPVADKQKALAKAQRLDPRQSADRLEQISAALSGQIAVLDAKIRNESDQTKIAEMARDKQILENRRRRINGGFEEQARLTDQLNSARSKK